MFRAREALFKKAAMLCDPTAHALAPQAKAGRFKFTAHDRDDFVLGESRACADFLKRGAIFPGEANDGGNLCRSESRLHPAKASTLRAFFGCPAASNGAR